MGWAVSYELRRATPLTEEERDTLRTQVKKYERIKWEVERYALELPESGEIVARGVTKVPWKTRHRNWASLMKALTELRGLIAGATCEVSDDHEAVSWDEAARRYTVVEVGDDDDDGHREVDRLPRGAVAYTVDPTKVLKSDPCSCIFVQSATLPMFHVVGARATFSVPTCDRTIVPTRIEGSRLTLLDAAGAVRQLRETYAAPTPIVFDLEPGVGAAITQIELWCSTRSECSGAPVAQFVCGAAGVELQAEPGTRFPQVALELACEPSEDGLTFVLDGTGAGLPDGPELEIAVVAFTEGRLELARTVVTASLAGLHVLTMAITAEQHARMRRVDVRVTGALRQHARVARWAIAR